jgi:hypothetical protein
LSPAGVGDCSLGLLLPAPPTGEPEAGRLLVVAPCALLHPHVPQPAGSLVDELLTGHPDRQPHELVFLAETVDTAGNEVRQPADGHGQGSDRKGPAHRETRAIRRHPAAV